MTTSLILDLATHSYFPQTHSIICLQVTISVCNILIGPLQVEFSYPPLIEGNSYESHEIPEEWKHIPSLALPDGAHNYEKGC